jgi:hypothetical protein
MVKAGQLLLLSVLLIVLVAILIGDLLPQFSPVNDAALGLSDLLGITYMQAIGVFVIFSLLAVAVCYVVAMKRRL